jgi:16S rRNA processing protein RimM
MSGDRVQVGRVGRPHGINGAFVVERPSETAERYAVGATLLVGGTPAKVVESKRSGGRTVIRLDRTVERGAEIELDRDDLGPPEPDSFYVFQLVGLAVEDQAGRGLGRVETVRPGVANDVLELDTGLALPMVEDCVVGIDLAGGRIVIAPGFGDEG